MNAIAVSKHPALLAHDILGAYLGMAAAAAVFYSSSSSPALAQSQIHSPRHPVQPQ